MGGAVIYIQRQFGLNSCHVQVLMSSLALIAVIGTLNASWVSDHFGRTKTLAVASIIFLIGNLIMAFGMDYVMILIGRCITGIGVGFGLSIDPVYIAELSPKRWRGFLTTFRYTL